MRNPTPILLQTLFLIFTNPNDLVFSWNQDPKKKYGFSIMRGPEGFQKVFEVPGFTDNPQELLATLREYLTMINQRARQELNVSLRDDGKFLSEALIDRVLTALEKEPVVYTRLL